MSVLCTICARGGSKRFPNKALRLLNGKSLISYTIKQALDSKVFAHVVVSTDSKLIADQAKTLGAESWFLRPKEFSKDNSNKLDAIRHALLETERLYKKKFDTIVDLDITSPLRKGDDIKNALKHFKDTDADNLITACLSKKNPYFNMVEIVNGQVQIIKKLEKQPFRYQDAPKTYEMNASIYIYKRKTLLSSNELFTAKTSIYEMSENQSMDVDTENDFNIVQFLLKNYYG